MTLEVPNYTLEKLLGAGANAQVWLGQHQHLQNRRVAIKILKPAALKQEFTRELFLREGNVLESLQHPGIVRIHDLGWTERGAYIVMELLTGGSLEDRMAQPIQVGEALGLVVQIASALEVAHRNHVVHRDLKPANIMLRDETTPVITDFGLARLVNLNQQSMLAGYVVGTANYMSPEQTRGESVDARSDLYALGVMFFELLTGHVPYSGAGLHEVHEQHRTAPLPQLPQPLAALQPILDRLLAKQPQQRYGSAQELVDALRRVYLDSEALRLMVGYAGTSRAWSSQLRVLGFSLDVPALVEVRVEQGRALAAREDRAATVAGAERTVAPVAVRAPAAAPPLAPKAPAAAPPAPVVQPVVAAAPVARPAAEMPAAPGTPLAERQPVVVAASSVRRWLTLAGGLAVLLGYYLSRPVATPEAPRNVAAEPSVRPAGTVFRDKLKDGSDGPEMVVIPAGSFMMGSPESEADRAVDEGPQHRVTLPAFAMGKTEVTLAQYRSLIAFLHRQAVKSVLWLDEADEVRCLRHVLHLAPNVPVPKPLIRRDGQSYRGAVLRLQGNGSCDSEGTHGFVPFQDRLEDVVNRYSFLKLPECPRLKSHPAGVDGGRPEAPTCTQIEAGVAPEDLPAPRELHDKWDRCSILFVGEPMQLPP